MLLLRPWTQQGFIPQIMIISLDYCFLLIIIDILAYCLLVVAAY